MMKGNAYLRFLIVVFLIEKSTRYIRDNFSNDVKLPFDETRKYFYIGRLNENEEGLVTKRDIATSTKQRTLVFHLLSYLYFNF